MVRSRLASLADCTPREVDHGMPLFRQLAMQRLVSVSQAHQACASQLLPRLFAEGNTEAQALLEDIQKEIMEVQEDNHQLLRILSSGNEKFKMLKKVFGMVVRKVDQAEEELLRFDTKDDLAFELKTIAEIQVELEDKAIQIGKFKEGMQDKEKRVQKIVTQMANKVTREDTSCAERSKIHDRRAYLMKETTKLTEEIAAAQRKKAGAAKELGRATDDASKRSQSIAYLESEHQRLFQEFSVLQALANEKNDAFCRARQRYAQESNRLEAEFAKKQHKLLERSAEELIQLKRRATTMQAKLFPKELAQLGRSYSGIHFVLCCDQSYSMTGERWNELVRSLETFGQASSDNHFSLILFNSTSHPYASDQPMSEFQAALTKVKAQQPDSGTSFSEAWRAVKFAAESADESRKTVVVFMTDGESGAADIAIAASHASSLYMKCRGRMSTFVIPFDMNCDGSFLSPIVKAGNGGEEFLSLSHNLGGPCEKVPLLHQADMGKLESVFTIVKEVVEGDVKQLKHLIQQHTFEMHNSMTDDQVSSIRILQAAMAGRRQVVECQREAELANLRDDLNPSLEDLANKREELSKVRSSLHIVQREQAGGMVVAEQEFKSVKEIQDRAIKEAEQRRERLDEEDARLNFKEQEVNERPPRLSGWFDTAENQALVSCILLAFCSLQRGQVLIQDSSIEKFEAVHHWVREIGSELRKPCACRLDRQQQFDQVIQYYKGTEPCLKMGGKATTQKADTQIMLMHICETGTKRNTAEQIEKAVEIISSCISPNDLIFVCKNGGDFDEEREHWIQGLEGRVNEALAATSCDLMEKQEAFNLQKDEVQDKKKAKDEMKKFGGDAEDIKEANLDLQTASRDMREKEKELKESRRSVTYITDMLKLILQSLDRVLREVVVLREFKDIRSRLSRYQDLFATEVMPFVDCADDMQRQALQTASAPRVQPCGDLMTRASWTSELLADLTVVPPKALQDYHTQSTASSYGYSARCSEVSSEVGYLSSEGGEDPETPAPAPFADIVQEGENRGEDLKKIAQPNFEVLRAKQSQKKKEVLVVNAPADPPPEDSKQEESEGEDRGEGLKKTARPNFGALRAKQSQTKKDHQPEDSKQEESEGEDRGEGLKKTARPNLGALRAKRSQATKEVHVVCAPADPPLEDSKQEESEGEDRGEGLKKTARPSFEGLRAKQNQNKKEVLVVNAPADPPPEDSKQEESEAQDSEGEDRGECLKKTARRSRRADAEESEGEDRGEGLKKTARPNFGALRAKQSQTKKEVHVVCAPADPPPEDSKQEESEGEDRCEGLKQTARPSFEGLQAKQNQKKKDVLVVNASADHQPEDSKQEESEGEDRGEGLKKTARPNFGALRAKQSQTNKEVLVVNAPADPQPEDSKQEESAGDGQKKKEVLVVKASADHPPKDSKQEESEGEDRGQGPKKTARARQNQKKENRTPGKEEARQEESKGEGPVIHPDSLKIKECSHAHALSILKAANEDAQDAQRNDDDRPRGPQLWRLHLIGKQGEDSRYVLQSTDVINKREVNFLMGLIANDFYTLHVNTGTHGRENGDHQADLDPTDKRDEHVGLKFAKEDLAGVAGWVEGHGLSFTEIGRGTLPIYPLATFIINAWCHSNGKGRVQPAVVSSSMEQDDLPLSRILLQPPPLSDELPTSSVGDLFERDGQEKGTLLRALAVEDQDEIYSKQKDQFLADLEAGGLFLADLEAGSKPPAMPLKPTEKYKLILCSEPKRAKEELWAWKGRKLQSKVSRKFLTLSGEPGEQVSEGTKLELQDEYPDSRGQLRQLWVTDTTGHMWAMADRGFYLSWAQLGDGRAMLCLAKPGLTVSGDEEIMQQWTCTCK